MRRIDRLLSGENCDHPHDVARMKELIPELRRLSDSEVERLYREYSDGYAAGWMMADDSEIYNFGFWLDHDDTEEQNYD